MENKNIKKIIFTGGHATPAFAVLDELVGSTGAIQNSEIPHPSPLPNGRQVSSEGEGMETNSPYPLLHKRGNNGAISRQGEGMETNSPYPLLHKRGSNGAISRQEEVVEPNSTHINSKGEDMKTDMTSPVAASSLKEAATPSPIQERVNLTAGGGVEIFWVGQKYAQRGSAALSAEFSTVSTKYKIPFYNLRAGKLVRAKDLKTIPSFIMELMNLFIGFVQSLHLIIKIKPDLVMSFGGFLAVPVVIWARIFGAKVITHEQTIVTGLANKIIGKFANKILISFETSKNFFNKSKTLFTGNPIRKDIFINKSNILKDFESKLPVLYVTGGNQGANEINKRILSIMNELLKFCNVIHQTGNSTITNDFEKAIQLKDSLSLDIKNRYLVKDYITSDEIGEVFSKADLLVSRAGANTVTEIMALGKMAILIPIPWASHNEQFKNANYLAELGLGRVLNQNNDFTPKILLQSIKESLKIIKTGNDFNGNSIEITKSRTKDLVNLNAAKQIAKIILSS